VLLWVQSLFFVKTEFDSCRWLLRMHNCIRIQSAGYIRKWYTPDARTILLTASGKASVGEFVAVIARLLLVVGAGVARVPTCDCAIQHVPGELAPSHRAVLVRALSLFGPGELRVLRGADSTVLKLALMMLQRDDAAVEQSLPTGGGHPTASEARGVRSQSFAQALTSLRVVGWSPTAGGREERIVSLIKRYASTLEDIVCPMWTFDLSDAWGQALAACTRLESFYYAHFHAPSTWLGLSHLHTLRGVDLHHVSAAAISAALPRLHTLEVVGDLGQPPPATAVAGFFEFLLPRLRAFYFCGSWPKDDPASIEPPRPLPLLRELYWHCDDFVSGFTDAHPVAVCAPFPTVVARWLVPTEISDCGQAARGPLARVRHLKFFVSLPTPTEMASVLRAAPELRTLVGGLLIRGGLGWADDPAFEGLINPWLRSIRVERVLKGPDDEYDLLRQRHFPRLQELLFKTMTAGDVV
jgi:hypothetical protein